MAEGGSDRVIVWTAPLAEEVSEPVDAHRGAASSGELAQHLLGTGLADTVGIVECGLDRGAEDDLRRTAELAQHTHEDLREPVVARIELADVLRTIDASKVKDNVGIRQGAAQVVSRICAAEDGDGTVFTHL